MLAGLLVGRWWTVGVSAVTWPALLVAGDVGSGPGFVLGAAALAVVNMAVGVAVHRAAGLAVSSARARAGSGRHGAGA